MAVTPKPDIECDALINGDHADDALGAFVDVRDDELASDGVGGRETELAPPGFERKIVTLDILLERRASLPEPVVFTNGVFDILHRGHVTYLARARALGAFLIVGVNSDASVRTLGKGADRPINRDSDRMALLAALADVDAVIAFEASTPVSLIEALRPDILVKGGDYDMDALPESALVRSWGGQAIAIPFEHQRSTTALLRKVRGH
jgi:rfaE bifunctional protein nucleotidyltransferase chain/domain